MITCFLFAWRKQSLLGQGFLFVEVSRSHSDTPRSVDLLCTSDRPIAETSTWQHTTLTRRQTSMPSMVFEPANAARERPQTRALNSAASGNGALLLFPDNFWRIQLSYTSIPLLSSTWTRGSAAGWGTALQAGRLPVRFPRVSLEFLTFWHRSFTFKF
jgi:hypothetical protein